MVEYYVQVKNALVFSGMQLTSLDWAIIAAYFVLSLAIGLYYYRRAGQSTGEFFVAGRDLPWWLAGTSMVATTFAADTPLAVTEMLTTVAIATAVWLTATFMTAPEPEAKLIEFYRRVHPAGSGWAPVAARAGAPRGERVERLPPGFVNWALGIVAVYSALFALREMFFGTLLMASLLAAAAVVAGVLLSRRLR